MTDAAVEDPKRHEAESQPTPPAAPAVQTTPLRQARERVGMHLAAVAVTLKVPVSRLEALEAGRYHELPDPTFVRALAKSVCKVLKIDPAPILESLPSAHVADLGPSAKAISAPMPVSRKSLLIGSTEATIPVPAPVLMAVLLLIAAVLLWLWLPERTPDPAAEAPALVATPAVAVASEEVALPPTAAPLPLSPAAATPDTPAVSPVTPTGTLVLTAAESTWVQVLGASGRVLLQRNLDSQESVAFSNDLPVAVVIGRADQVTVSVRGQAFDVQPWTRSNVARFEVQ